MPRIARNLLGWFLLLLLWELSTATKLADPLFVASPVETANALFQGLLSGRIVMAAALTTGLALSGFFIGVILGIPLGLALGGIRMFRDIFGGIVDSLRSVPSTALFPLFLLFFGVGRISKIAVAAFICTLALAIYTASAVPDYNSTIRFLLRLRRVSAWRKLVDGMFFPAIPGIAGGMRTAISMALVGTLANEMIIGTDVGLGRLIFDSQMTFRIPEMYAAIVATGAIGVLLNQGLIFLLSRLFRWRQFDEVA